MAWKFDVSYRGEKNLCKTEENYPPVHFLAKDVHFVLLCTDNNGASRNSYPWFRTETSAGLYNVELRRQRDVLPTPTEVTEQSRR